MLAEAGPAPELPGYARSYFEAFRVLQHDRDFATEFRMVVGPQGVPITQSIMVELPIAFAALDRYARRYRIEGERFDRLVRVVRKMDETFRAVMAERRELGEGSPGNDNG